MAAAAVSSNSKPAFCIFSLSAGSSTIGRHSLIRKFQLIAQRGFQSVELMQDDLDAFADSDEFEAIYRRQSSMPTPPLSPTHTFTFIHRRKDEPTTTTTAYNAFGPCTPAKLHREVAAAAYIGLLATSLGIQVASFQPLRDFEGWAKQADREDALARAASRFEVMHALGTNMLFICSNCQPAEKLVPASDYTARAGADLARLGDLAAQWLPMNALAQWHKRGLADPIQMMNQVWKALNQKSDPWNFDNGGAALPLSPPDSRASSISIDYEDLPTDSKGVDLTHLPNVAEHTVRRVRPNTTLPSSFPHFPTADPSNSPPRTFQPIKIGYEALSWGTHVDLWRSAWSIVQSAARPNIGIVLDSFNTIAREWADPCSPTGISQPEHLADQRLADSIAQMGRALDPEKIFFLQIADARRLRAPLPPSPNKDEPRPARMIWSRANRLFPLESERGAFLPILGFVTAVARLGYQGPWSVEVFSDSIHDEDEGVPREHIDRGYRSLERLVEAVREQE
ncbi:hypothetical protein V8E36_007947 [Tilletia maclaganii]